jgi:hypothetical protein
MSTTSKPQAEARGSFNRLKRNRRKQKSEYTSIWLEKGESVDESPQSKGG